MEQERQPAGAGTNQINRPSVDVRSVRRDDRGFVLEAVNRLAAFGAPPGRTLDEIVEGEARTLRAFFDRHDPPETLLVADVEGRAGGFIFLEEKQDYFTLEAHGHIGILVVGERAEGRGVGGALMRAAEAWAEAKGYRKLTLNVFAGNGRARTMYEHLGFSPDTVKYLKTLRA